MAIYTIDIIRDLFEEDDCPFEAVEGYEADIDNVQEAKQILNVPPRINLCYYLNTQKASELEDYLISKYEKYRCTTDTITNVELKGIYFASDKTKYKDILSMLLANMVQRQGDKVFTRVFMGKEGLYQKKYERYNPLGVKLDKLKNLLTFLSKNDYIDLYYNNYKSKFETRYKVNLKLSSLFKQYEITQDDVSLSEDTNFIELGIEKVKSNGRKSKILIDFEDTEVTSRRNEILEAYNELFWDWKDRINFKKSMPHLIYARCKYNDVIGRGGRVYAPWQWGEIRSDDRLKFIIDDSKVVEVDIKSCSLRIACHLLDFDPKQEDLYDIGNSSYPRKDIKFTVQQILNMNSSESRSLAQRLVDVSNSLELKTLLNNDDSSYIRQLAEDIYNYYDTDDMNNLSSKMFFQDKGMTDIMNVETAVVFDVIEYFTASDEIVLTIHDSYVVKEELQDDLIRMIEESYHKYTNYKPILTIDKSNGDSSSVMTHSKLREMIYK